MEAEYVMIESFRDAQPDEGDSVTVSSPGIESMDQAADAASTALRHAEGARGLAVFGEPVLVSELDAQEQIRQLTRHMEDLKVQIANQEDADMGVDLLGLDDPAGGASNLPAAPGALGPDAGEVATTAGEAAVVATTSSSTTPATAAQPDPLAAFAEPPVAWPVSAEPRPAAPPNDMEEDGASERAGLGFTPPAPAGYLVDPHAAMEPSTPWAFKDGNPQKRIAALELLGTLLLCKHLVAQQGQLPGRVRLPVGSDNSGNIFSLLNLSAKKPYSAALLMELVLFLHCEGCSIAPNYVPTEYNTWADELTHPDFKEFSLDRRLPAPETLFVFPLATRLLSSTGLS